MKYVFFNVSYFHILTCITIIFLNSVIFVYLKKFSHHNLLSRYFCNLEKQNAASKYMPKLKTERGVLTDQKEIEKEQYNYFSTLYKKRNNRSVSIENFLGQHAQTINKLSDKSKHICDEPISLPEIGKYLKSVPNNKSPGMSGYTGEFYKFVSKF